MEYNFKEIEKKWQAYWAANHTFKAEIDNSKPKFYVLDMSHIHLERVCMWDILLDI